jgi:outer membrane protein OmpA-like peptidoglycan-associated protein
MAQAMGLALGALAIAGCASAPPPKPSPEPTFVWQRTAQKLLDSVLAQGLAERMPSGVREATQAQALSVRLSTDESMRLEGGGGPGLASFLAQRIDARHPRFARSETAAVEGAAPRWELRTQLTALDPSVGLGPSAYLMSLELFDPARGRVLASGRERFVDPSLDALRAPKPAPRIASAPPPSPAVEPPKPTAAQLQALNAEYLALIRQGREDDARKVFSRLVAESLIARNLNLRFLFGSGAGATQFLQDAVLLRRYDSWLAELARQLRDAPHCLQIVGHASRGGPEPANKRVSLARAETVKDVLLKHGPALGPRLSTVGLGSTQASAAKGADGSSDALDRRVELRVIDCP